MMRGSQNKILIGEICEERHKIIANTCLDFGFCISMNLIHKGI